MKIRNWLILTAVLVLVAVPLFIASTRTPVEAQKGPTLETQIYTWDGSAWDKVAKGRLNPQYGTGATVAAKGSAADGWGIHQTTVTFAMTGANDIDVADGDKTTGVKVYDFPAGRILILGATINALVTTNNAFNANPNDVYYVGVGTADGTQAADADLTNTEQDIIPKTTLDSVGNTDLDLDWHAALAASAQFDGTSTAVDLYVNVAVPAASNSKASTHAVTGTMTVTWINLGDY
jgi:hypothetical protein